MIRVLVAGDAPARRGALAAALARDPGLELAGETSAAERAAAIAATEPDVMLALARDVRTLEPTDPPTVVVGDDGLASGALGAHGVLARDASPEEIVAAIRAVAAGLVVRHPAGPGERRPEARREDRASSLSQRERDVLAHLASGASNKRIADVLGISDHTVKTHIAAIFSKLAVSSRTEAVTLGVRLGLVML